MAKERLPKEFRLNAKMFAEALLRDDSTEQATMLALIDDLDAADAEIARISDSLRFVQDMCDGYRTAYEVRVEEIARINAALAESERRAKRAIRMLRKSLRTVFEGDELSKDDWNELRDLRIVDDEGFFESDEGDGDGE